MTGMDCPAPDCDYTGASEEAVRGHWGGSQDEQHSGKYHQAREAYDSATAAHAEDSTANESPDEPDEKPAEHGHAHGAESVSDGGHPKDDVPPADPKEPDTGGSDGHELPCGHHVVTDDDLPDSPFHVIVTCETCGRDYEVKHE
jgi:hypothetical protein